MPSYSIEIRNAVSRHKIPSHKVKRVAARILKTLGWKQAELGILLVSDRAIRVLNKRYLRHDRSTDVMAFSYGGQSSKKGIGLLGDLVISLDTTARQAKQYGNSFFYELCFYVCHGVLHLTGYSDGTPKQAALMDRKQKAILKKIGIGQWA